MALRERLKCLNSSPLKKSRSHNTGDVTCVPALFKMKAISCTAHLNKFDFANLPEP